MRYVPPAPRNCWSKWMVRVTCDWDHSMDNYDNAVSRGLVYGRWIIVFGIRIVVPGRGHGRWRFSFTHWGLDYSRPNLIYDRSRSLCCAVEACRDFRMFIWKHWQCVRTSMLCCEIFMCQRRLTLTAKHQTYCLQLISIASRAHRFASCDLTISKKSSVGTRRMFAQAITMSWHCCCNQWKTRNLNVI